MGRKKESWAIYIDTRDLDVIRALAKRMDVSMSDLGRTWIRQGLYGTSEDDWIRRGLRRIGVEVPHLGLPHREPADDVEADKRRPREAGHQREDAGGEKDDWMDSAGRSTKRLVDE